MRNEATIKKIGDYEICVSDSIKSNITWKTILMITIIPFIGIFVLLCWMEYCIAPEKMFQDISSMIILSTLFTILTGALGLMTDAFQDHYPCYNVFIKGSYKSDEFIQVMKSTPDEDQIGVCKASKILEDKAQAYEDEKDKIKKIAANCR